MHANQSLDYSIIICSFNPEERILKRCLAAISELNVADLNYEIILVDNNSAPALSKIPYVQDFLNKTEHARSILATEQGLIHARIKGIEEAKGKYIVFFDDDNEPDKEYIRNLSALHQQYPNVAAWGPGNIWVDFIDGLGTIDIRTETIARKYFQERHDQKMAYASNSDWQSCYPYGTGLSIEYRLLWAYSRLVKEGKYNAVGRKGESLTSGEDLQMVLYCIQQFTAAGVCPSLKINHIIPQKRANFNYLKKLVYATTLSYPISTRELMDDQQKSLSPKPIASLRFQRKALLKFLSILLTKDQRKTLQLLHYIGMNSGRYVVMGQKIPTLIIRILQSLGLEKKHLAH